MLPAHARLAPSGFGEFDPSFPAFQFARRLPYPSCTLFLRFARTMSS